MLPANGNFTNLVSKFEKLVASVHESRPFAQALCGPKSLLAQLVDAALGTRQPDQGALRPVLAQKEASPPAQGAIRKLLETLDYLDNQFENKAVPEVYQQDPTLPGRWQGLSQIVRSLFVIDFNKYLQQAKNSFDQVWEQAKLGEQVQTQSIADESTAEKADASLFAKVKRYLKPWTPGSWMVWDILGQLNGTAAPVADETTPVLFACGNQGQVMRLVVEVLPGPPGLVMPNWWRLGLCCFSSPKDAQKDEQKEEEWLLQAVQGLIGRIAKVTAAAPRFRWYLTTAAKADPLKADPIDSWRIGFTGRSVEAAAAVAALAVLEQYRERPDRKDKTAEPPPILDDQAVVTAVVRPGGVDPCNWPLENVSGATLEAKIKAARDQGLDVIGVPDGQQKGLEVPEGSRVEGVKTVGEAFELLRVVSRALDRYGDYVRSQFKYHAAETPPSR